MNFYFICILEINENYNKIDAIHNLLNNLKLTSKEFSKSKKLKYFIKYLFYK